MCICVYVYVVIENTIMSCAVKLQYVVCCQVVMMFLIRSGSFIVYIATRCVIKLHGKYVLFSVVLLVIGFIEHRGRFSPTGEGFVTTLVKIQCKNI